MLDRNQIAFADQFAHVEIGQPDNAIATPESVKRQNPIDRYCVRRDELEPQKSPTFLQHGWRLPHNPVG